MLKFSVEVINMNKMRSLSLLGFSFCIIILLSLIMPIYTIVDVTGSVKAQHYTCSNLLLDLFNGSLQGNTLGIMVAICYLMLLFVTIMFFVFAILRTKRVFIYRRWLIAISLVMLFISFVMIVLSFIHANANAVYSGLELVTKYNVSVAPYLNLFLSVYMFISTLIVGTYCVQNKK